MGEPIVEEAVKDSKFSVKGRSIIKEQGVVTESVAAMVSAPQLGTTRI